MGLTGIIAEFNPIHKGHEYLIKEAKKHGPVACVISGNFVQRGEAAIAEKRIRAKSAILAGADIVLELPVLWSMSTAQNFALGGVSALGSIGCDSIMFGSECGNVEELIAAAEILSSSEFSERLTSFLKEGITFAAAREKAAKACGLEGNLLKGANNNLAIEYIIAAKNLSLDIKFDTVMRKGAAHDSLQEAEFVSATLLRQKLREGDTEFCGKYMPMGTAELFNEENISDMSRIERAVLGVLRTKTAEDLKKLPDLSEGVENKLFSAIKLANSLEGLYNSLKVKRYTHARLRRLVLSAFLGADNSFFMKPVPYVRVLGFNKAGQALLKEIVKESPLPVITKAADIKLLPKAAQRVFETECKATDLFALSLKEPFPCGLEYTAKIIKTE